ncbi:hypothetical protein C8P63_10625 [Melghirimyces profundicolus]|uniref:Sortilin (Neurotensin receptor 3) n=1 Tax=Melghirimyces profundicolus TaxID=1242148 RepID=A0A2T6C0B7_9BACL|nr:glycosyl hydrolase [Melghirimyces profundicolus]PTX61773.1 hypothetical protein C8P63_10625 [Melghirimyces profundicolus]
MTRWKFGALALAIGTSLLFSGCNAGSGDGKKEGSLLNAQHIHGLSHSTDGKKLIAATHDGLHRYQNGKWTGPVGEPHDLMGFSYTKKGIFASGHPAEGSDLPDPLGLIRSDDGGNTWKPVKFQGESDFHYMSAGFESGAIYVWNEHPNKEMKTGLYVSRDQGGKWFRVSSRGLEGKLITLAAHPTATEALAVGTDNGVYRKPGKNQAFEKILGGLQATALLHDRTDPSVLWVGGHTGQPILYKLDSKTKKKEEIPLPFSDTDDAIQFIAQSSTDPNRLAIATFKGHIFTSSDGGKKWEAIGKGKAEEHSH